MNETSNNQNNGLNSFSLGNVNIDTPVEPVKENIEPEVIESLDQDSPVTPVPLNEEENNLNNAYDIPKTLNAFNAAPSFNDIGTIPPIGTNEPVMQTPNNPPKKKKGMNKTTFIILIILSLVIVASVVYLLLNKTQNNSSKTNVKVKEVTIEYMSEISKDIKDYADFTGIDPSQCSLDTTNIEDSSKLNAEYSFTIQCGNMTYTGKAKVADTIAPEVTLKEVEVPLNKEVKPEDFILECNDLSECSYEFKDPEKVKSYYSTAADYHVDIIIKDASGNITEKTGTLKVSEIAADLYLACTKETEKVKLGLVDNEFKGLIIKEYTFTLEEDYEQVKEEAKDKAEITYEEITGTPKFNDENKTLVITKILNEEEKKEEYPNLPTSLSELKQFFQSQGYTCRYE